MPSTLLKLCQFDVFVFSLMAQWATTNAHCVTWRVQRPLHGETISSSATATRSHTAAITANTGFPTSWNCRKDTALRASSFTVSLCFVLCAARCKRLADLHKHLETHSSEPAYRCYIPDCSFTSRSLITMKLHQKKKHEVKMEEDLLKTIAVARVNLFYCLWTGGLCSSLQMPRVR